MVVGRWVIGLLAAICLSGTAQAKCVLQRFADLPVTMRGLEPIVPAKINGRDVSFVADSGSFFSSISANSAADLNLRTEVGPFGLFVGGVGGDATVRVATVKSFGVSGGELKNVDFLIDGGEFSGGEAIGLLGQNILGLQDAEYDLSGGVIRLERPQGCGGRPLAYWAGTTPWSAIDIEERDPRKGKYHIVGAATVNGVRMHVLFDTGAGASVLSVGAARRAGIRTDGPGVRFAGYTWGIGRKMVKTWVAPVDSFQLGDEGIKHTQMRIGEIGDLQIDMLIGADFFLSHHIFVANSQQKLYFTYNGGPVFNLESQPLVAGAASEPSGPHEAAPAPAGATPEDAAELSRRAAGLAARRDFGRALNDLDKAVTLAPSDPHYRLQRAQMRLAIKQTALAMADLNAGLKLAPSDARLRILRAGLRLADDDPEGARADLDAASAAEPLKSDLHFDIAHLYGDLSQFESAIREYDIWIHDHGEDGRMAAALNGRCWVRALSNQALDLALIDCNKALKLTGGGADFLDSRGLVHLRRGEFDKAVADYDAALKQDPKLAWSLYGRGLIEAKSGEASRGATDIAAAEAIEPKLAARAAKLGLAAPGAPSATPVSPSPAPTASR